MSSKTRTKIMVAIVTVAVLWSMASCSPKYGCYATKGKVGYHPYEKSTAR